MYTAKIDLQIVIAVLEIYDWWQLNDNGSGPQAYGIALITDATSLQMQSESAGQWGMMIETTSIEGK